MQLNDVPMVWKILLGASEKKIEVTNKVQEEYCSMQQLRTCDKNQAQPEKIPRNPCHPHNDIAALLAQHNDKKHIV